MRLLPILTILGLSILGVSCSKGLTKAEVTPWLEARSAAPDLDVAGAWDSVRPYLAGGWGPAVWVQSGAQVTGTLGPLDAQGRVAGRKLFLALSSRGQVTWTAVLEPTKDGGLTGFAVAKALAKDPTDATQEHTPLELMRPVAGN